MRRLAIVLFSLALLAPASASAQGDEKLLALAALAAPLSLPDESVEPPTLKTAVSISGAVVHIGDLIAHAGAVADVAIFRSPDPGTTGTVATVRVLEAVRPYGLAAIDTGGADAVTVTRSGRAIDAQTIKDAIRNTLAGQRGLGNAADLQVTLDQPLHAIHVESTASGSLQATRLLYSPTAQRFDITMVVPGSASMRETPLRLTGTVIETAEVAVLSHSLKRGDIIRNSDLVLERRPRAELGDDRIGQIALAVGSAAQRQLRRGQALRQSDLMKAEIVQRNAMVTLVYEAPGIMLTMRGKAQQSGAEGDVVNILNLQSNRVLQGTVTGPDRVTVAGTAIRIGATAANTQQPSNNGPQPE